MRGLRSVAGIVGKASRQLSMFNGSGVIGRVIARSADAVEENKDVLQNLPDKKAAAYLDHLKFLRPGGFEGIEDVADVSHENLVKYADIVDNVPDNDWSLADEEELLKKVDGLNFELRHGSRVPDLIVDSGFIKSRAALRNSLGNVPGLMKKTGDETYHYEDFVFFNIKGLPVGAKVEPQKGVFKFPFDSGISSESCMFLKDCFSLIPEHIVGKKSSYPGSPSVKSFNGVSCYLETDQGKFRFKVIEDGEVSHVTDFVDKKEQFFFGDDVKNAISLTAFMYSKIFGREFLLAKNDKEFAKEVTDLAGFECRIPREISLDKGVHCYEPGKSMSAEDGKRLVREASQEVDYYNGNVY